jgi:hypothetical protein
MIHKKGAKLDPPLRLDMSFEESLERFTATKPKEVDESIERSKKKGPESEVPPTRPPRKKR